LEEINKLPEDIVKRCKVFMLTSTTDQKDIEKSKAHKLVCDFISKPLTVEKLETLFFSPV
ncbi:MAG TPA: response regulator, partial [Bacteroidia bacterium]|nr:response regulator [Bacteroidia bacterium]